MLFFRTGARFYGDRRFTMTRHHVRQDIQGLRALAVLLVILFHLGAPIYGGYIGVDIFFVISGFVITMMLEREWNKSGKISIRSFFIRRFWRLTPVLALVVTTTLGVGCAVLSAYRTQNLMVVTSVGAMFFSANVAISTFTGGYFGASASSNPLTDTWSLSVEEQFYIGFLFVLIAGFRVGKFVPRSRAAVLLPVSAIFAASLIIAILAQPGHLLDYPNGLFHFYSPINRAWEFASG